MAGEPIRIALLGGLEVDGAGVPWPTRRAAELVALLALADGRRLPREQAIDALWPTLAPEAGAANLRKAAHHARRALGDEEAVVLRGGLVALFPDRDVRTDVEAFEAGDAAAYGGALLPDFPYEDWTQAARARLHARRLDALRGEGRWEEVVALEPTDEAAYRELMRRELDAGRRPAAIRWFGRLRTALRRELGLHPGAETVALYDECIAGLERRRTPFVGRSLELARATARLRDDPGEALVVRGPGGIGKSALCREIASAAQAESWTVFATAASEAAVPYGPLIAVVEHHARLLDAVGEPARAALNGLTSAGAGLTRHRVIGAFRRLLLAAAGDGPVLLVVDDAHLADEATLDVLAHLGPPVLLVLAYRPQPAGSTLSRLVARLERSGRLTAIDLEPLGRGDAATLVAAAAATPRDAATVERILELGQGNPFLVLELARSAVVGVPALVANVRDAVASRFLDLDDDTVAMLRRLALAGDDLDPAAVVALTGVPEPEAFAALDTALGSGVLVVEGAHYRFRHELVRQALVDQLAPHQRIAIHRETAQRLAEAGGEPELVARHWLDGGRPREAVPWLLEAGRRAVGLGAFADALLRLDRLLEHEPGHGEALRLRAEALDALGDSRAPAAFARAAEVVGPSLGDDLRARGALATIKLGDAPGGLRLAEGLQPTTLDGRIAHALAFAGGAALGFGDPEVGAAKAAEARRLALESGEPGAVAVASWAQAAAAHATGELRDSVRADLHDTHALPKLAVSAFDGQLCITQRLLYGARPYADVITFADSLLAEAERLGAARGRAFAVTIRGEAKLLAGDLDGAEADLLEGVRHHRELGGATGEAFALQRLSEVSMHRGRRAEAVGRLDEALAIARESDVGFHLFDRIYGTRITLAETPEAALAVLEEAESAVRGPLETCPGCRITLAVPAAIAAARAGDPERTAEWSTASEYLANVVMRLPAWHAAYEEVLGHSAGSPAEAAEHFHRAADGFAAAEQPLDASRCAELAGLRPV